MWSQTAFEDLKCTFYFIMKKKKLILNTSRKLLMHKDIKRNKTLSQTANPGQTEKMDKQRQGRKLCNLIILDKNTFFQISPYLL